MKTLKDIIIDVFTEIYNLTEEQTLTLKDGLQKFGLEKITDYIPGLDTNDLDIDLLKSLFEFKGTFKDLLYIIKLSKLNIEIEDGGKVGSYGDITGHIIYDGTYTYGTYNLKYGFIAIYANTANLPV